jgi:hypothetical protein
MIGRPKKKKATKMEIQMLARLLICDTERIETDKVDQNVVQVCVSSGGSDLRGSVIKCMHRRTETIKE